MMVLAIEKICPVCGDTFQRRHGLSVKQWEGQKTCGHKCGEQFRRLSWRPAIRPLAERFVAMVDKSPGLGPHGQCWEWRGGVNNQGYGQIGLGARSAGTALAHRVAWVVAHGEWPTLNILHGCDNPRCVRLDHLFEGTQSDNMRDASAKGRI
ncbi:MAG: HNH endonuclease signature motif containing protein [Candidatus Omnitrophota bacterium]|nr:HNH endonuclease signature motif containing protein [Candidatus Omnitrophota bacterium]